MKPKLLPSLSLVWLAAIAPATAQTYQPSNRIPVADNSLGTQVVSGGNNNFAITGGLNRGQNVFHSFQDFSVPTGGSATFINPVGNQSIITRVTGSNFSDLNGLINTQGANFFLINPNGIVFGTGIKLNVGQTFVGSTASSINLVDSGGNSVNFAANRSGDAGLLTINSNALFSPLNPVGGSSQISNFGRLENTNPNISAQNFGLFGGDITFNGGVITAPGGRIELNAPGADISLANVSKVNVAGAGGGEISVAARNIELTNGSFIRGGIEAGFGTPGAVAGDVKVTATGNVAVSNSKILNVLDSNAIGKGGNIAITAGSLSLSNAALFSTSTLGYGDGGNIKIVTPGSINLTSVASFSSFASAGNAGNIAIEAGSLSLSDGTSLSASSYGKGNAGSIKIATTGSVTLTNANMFSTIEAGGEGKGGNIEITAGALSLQNAAQLQTFVKQASDGLLAGKGDAGNVNLKVAGAVDIAGNKNRAASGIFSSTSKEVVGNGGNITIEAGSLSMSDSGRLEASTFGKGDGGSIKIVAKDRVSLSNAGMFSTIEAGSDGKGGNIEITAGSLSLQNAALLETRTAGKGDAGNVTLKVAGAVDITVKETVSANGIASYVDEGAVGNGGNITIDAGSLSLRNSSLFTITSGTGNSGTIIVNANDFVTISSNNQQLINGLFVSSGSLTGKAGDIFVTAPKITIDSAKIDARSTSVNNGGNIQIGGMLPNKSVSAETKLITLRRGAQISTEAGGNTKVGGNGGNITIFAPNGFIVTAPNENSDISANGFSGAGGKVTINTQQNYWISALSRSQIEQLLGTIDPNQLNPISLSSNDITAISQVNPNLNGQVSITSPEIDPSRGLSPLPNNVTDPSDRIDPNCSTKAIANNSFTNVGRGGIPASPKTPLNEENIATNWVGLNPQDTRSATAIVTSMPAQLPQPIVEAQAWRRDINGDIVLLTGTSAVRLPRPFQPSAKCTSDR